jgi:hypothetical protein
MRTTAVTASLDQALLLEEAPRHVFGLLLIQVHLAVELAHGIDVEGLGDGVEDLSIPGFASSVSIIRRSTIGMLVVLP